MNKKGFGYYFFLQYRIHRTRSSRETMTGGGREKKAITCGCRAEAGRAYRDCSTVPIHRNFDPRFTSQKVFIQPQVTSSTSHQSRKTRRIVCYKGRFLKDARSTYLVNDIDQWLCNEDRLDLHSVGIYATRRTPTCLHFYYFEIKIFTIESVIGCTWVSFFPF